MNRDSDEEARAYPNLAPTASRRRFILPICLSAAAAVVVCAVLLALPPGPHSLYPPCPFHWATGLHCPGCGTLRCAHALLHGHLLAALRYNALTIAVLCGFVWAAARMAFREFAGSGRDAAWTPVPLILIRLLAPATVLFAVLRNIPVWPLYLLSPGG